MNIDLFSSLSIKSKLAVTIILSIFMATLLSAGILVYAQYEEEESRLVNNIELHARITSANSASALQTENKQIAAEILHALSVESAIHGAVIYDEMQNEFASYIRRAELINDNDFGGSINFEGYLYFKVYAPVTINDKNIGSLILLASRSEIYSRLIEFIVIIAVVFFLTGFVAYLGTVKLQNYIYLPINHMVSVANKVKENDYSVRVEKYFDDELGVLTDNFNQMLEQVQQRDNSLEKIVHKRTQELEEKNNRLKHEIKNRLIVQSELLDSEKKFRSTFSNAAICMLLIDKQGSITQANKAACSMFGYEENEFYGKTFLDITFKDDIDISTEKRNQLIEGVVDFYRQEKRYVRKDGVVIWGLLTVSGVFDKSGEFSYGISQIIDITEEYRLSKELTHQASHDALTGLINRREFEKRIHHAWKTASSGVDIHVLSFIDLDQFKVINDTCGHVAGDEMLRQIALFLKEIMRKGDSIARLGGDEFGVLMEHCSLQSGLHVIENIRRKIESFQFVWEDNRFKVGASIGVVQIDAGATSVVELLKQADTACFAAKDEGRNRINIYCAEDEVLSKRRGEMQWIHRIQDAIDEDRLVLHAQPIVSVLEPEHGLHFELLVRLITEEGEEIMPGAFMPSAERYGLTPKVDRWVINHVLDWMSSQSTFVRDRINLIGINLSGLTLSDDDFLERLVDKICANNIPTEKLCFEITETAFIANLTKATKFIHALRRLGCKFALDDFGSGLSSFAYLKNLQVDYLKIDGMFVRDILHDPIDFALVRSINEMGKVMGKKTIAEFVENRDILEKIKEIGVDYAQGYGVGEVVSLSELADYSSSHEYSCTRILRVIK